MALPKKNTTSAAGYKIGIKELKNHTSKIIDQVSRTKRTAVIHKNSRPVAKIEPLEGSGLTELEDLGILGPAPSQSWQSLHLHPINISASIAIQSISDDRDDE